MQLYALVHHYRPTEQLVKENDVINEIEFSTKIRTKILIIFSEYSDGTNISCTTSLQQSKNSRSTINTAELCVYRKNR